MKCTFCQTEIEPGTGMVYVQKDGKMFHFCSSKCEKNQVKLKRKGRNMKWTDTFHELKRKTKK